MRDTSRRIAKCALAFLFGLLSLGLCQAEEEETLFVNGVIWTANSKQPHAEAVQERTKSFLGHAPGIKFGLGREEGAQPAEKNKANPTNTAAQPALNRRSSPFFPLPAPRCFLLKILIPTAPDNSTLPSQTQKNTNP